MNANHKAVELAKALLEYCGIAADDFGETNKALISLDYETTVILAVEGGVIHLISAIGPFRGSEALYRRLLERNFRSLAKPDYRFAVEPESGELMLARSLPADDRLAGGAMVEIFLGYVAYCERCARAFTGRPDEVVVPEPVASAAPQPEAVFAPGEPDARRGATDAFLRRV